MIATDYKLLFEALPQPYIVFTATKPYTFIDASDSHLALTGVDRKKLIGKGFFDVFPDTSKEYTDTGVSPIETVFKEVASTSLPVTLNAFRYDIPDKDGTYIEKYWEPVHYPILASDGSVSHILQLSRDVTEESEAAGKLISTERNLAMALDIGLLAMWDWNILGNVVTGSKNLSVFYGADPDQVAAGLPLEVFTSAIHSDDRDRVTALIADAVKSGKQFDSEYRTVDQLGTVRWVIARGQVEYDDSGAAIHFPGIILDITTRKQTEFNAAFIADASKALAGSLDYEKTLATVAELAVPSIADWCSVVIVNDSGELDQVAIAHKDPEKVAWAREFGTNQRSTIDDDMNASARVIKSGKSEFYPEITQQMLEASAIPKAQLKLATDLELRSLIVVPLHDQAKNIGAITMILTGAKRLYTDIDLILIEELAERISLAITNARLYEASQYEISRRKKLQAQLKKANEDLEAKVERRTKQLHDINASLERSNGELENFAYVASHDLQEPLRKIQAFGDILSDEFADQLGDGKDYLERMQAAAGRMSTLIEDLLAFSRVTTHAKPFVRVNLDEVFLDVVEDLSDRIERTGGSVTAGALPAINGDETQLRQLFQNLIGNALKFHKPDEPPAVRVECEKTDTTVTVRVTDNGIGLDEKYADRIFAVFQRLHGRDEFEGTGIGLAVCKKIVERHGGTITVTSQPGKGTTFVVSLPVSLEANK